MLGPRLPYRERKTKRSSGKYGGTFLSRIVQNICLLATLSLVSSATADTVSFTGNLLTNATFAGCGPGCMLGSGNSDSDYAHAAVVYSFSVPVASAMSAITVSYGGRKNG